MRAIARGVVCLLVWMALTTCMAGGSFADESEAKALPRKTESSRAEAPIAEQAAPDARISGAPAPAMPAPALPAPGTVVPAVRLLATPVPAAAIPSFDGLSRWLELSGIMAAGAAGRLLADMDFDMRVRAPRIGRFMADLSIDGRTAQRDSAVRGHRLGSSARLRMMGAHGDMWVGGGGGAAWNGSIRARFSTLESGLNIRAGRFSASLSLSSMRTSQPFERVSYVSHIGSDSLLTREKVIRKGSERLSCTDAQMGLSWTHGRIEIGAVGGMRIGPGAERGMRWLQVRNSLRLTDGLALTLQGGGRPGAPEMGLPSEHFFAVSADIRFPGRALRDVPGFRAAAAPLSGEGERSPFSAARLAAESCRITIVIPGARSVLISGDFSDWKPLAMRRASGHAWQADVHASPGAHRISVSVDGGPWQAPPGLTAQPDEFGQTSGIMFVR